MNEKFKNHHKDNKNKQEELSEKTVQETEPVEKEINKEQELSKVIEIKESEYNSILNELDELKDKNIRIYAEFDNARKRMERDKIEFIKYANEVLIVEFLNVLDDLERTVQAAKAKHQDYEAFLKGIEMVMKHINNMLSKNGVKKIEAKGKMFDPHCHEAMLQEENKDLEEGTVIDELQTGYYLGDRVVRTSKVKLAKKPQGESEENKNASDEKQ